MKRSFNDQMTVASEPATTPKRVWCMVQREAHDIGPDAMPIDTKVLAQTLVGQSIVYLEQGRPGLGDILQFLGRVIEDME